MTIISATIPASTNTMIDIRVFVAAPVLPINLVSTRSELAPFEPDTGYFASAPIAALCPVLLGTPLPLPHSASTTYFHMSTGLMCEAVIEEPAASSLVEQLERSMMYRSVADCRLSWLHRRSGLHKLVGEREGGGVYKHGDVLGVQILPAAVMLFMFS